jgi:class 3 adenylate cyclase
MRCPSCRQEAPSDANFCPTCGTRLVRTCLTCGTELSGGARLCVRCGQSVNRVASDTVATVEVPGSEARPAEETIASQNTLEDERRVLTVLFADLKGSMELLADRDQEAGRKVLDRVLEHMVEAVHRYDGTVTQIMGDGIMALFGAPSTHENHGLQACCAAIAMHEAGAARRPLLAPPEADRSPTSQRTQPASSGARADHAPPEVEPDAEGCAAGRGRRRVAGGVRQCNARPAAVPLRGRRRTRAFRRRM